MVNFVQITQWFWICFEEIIESLFNQKNAYGSESKVDWTKSLKKPSPLHQTIITLHVITASVPTFVLET